MRRVSFWRGLATGLIIGLVLTCASAAAARPARATRVSEPLQLVFPLRADNAGLIQFARSVSTIGSPEYGRFRSIAWLSRRFGASPRTRRTVIAFLRRIGAGHIRVDATGLLAEATLPAARADRIFRTRLLRFAPARGAAYMAPAAPVSLPAGLRGAVTGVVGLDTRPLAGGARFHRAAAQSSSAYEPATGTPSGCAAGRSAGGFSPNQYLTAYGYDPLHAAGATGQGERVALIEIDGFREGDIRAFASCFNLRLPPIEGFGVGVSQPLPPGGESTLDLEVLDAAAPGLKAIDVYESKPDAAHVLLALTAPLENSGYRPQVISASLGLCEQNVEQAVGRGGIVASESALADAAASGISFLAATGDNGSADCVDASSPTALPAPFLAVNYPASSPWATAVGGTNLILNAQNQIQSEAVWNDGSAAPGAASGGGSSMLFTRPGYQSATVSPNRRAVPDVALLADIAPGYDVYCSASPDCINSSQHTPWQTVGGTSAATPLLAGGLALIDQQLRIHQRQDLGLVNPLLYRIGRNPTLAASVFYDVTQGSNDVGPFLPPNYQPLGCCSAQVGFDLASGWGGVNLSALALHALVSQPPIVGVGLTLPRRQRPVRARHILATVSCNGPCLLGAAARITIGRARPFTDHSRLYRLGRAGRKTIPIGFTPRQLGQLRTALSHHDRITAVVTGAIADAGGNIERQSAPRTLKITA